jgi:23S rRNA (guanosine2251-2'-O)-methyltransferase
MRKLANSELDRLSVAAFKEAEKAPLAIILDDVRSLNNIGSVFRTADAFRASIIYLCGITATPPHRDIHKTALGATEAVAWKYLEKAEEAVMELQQLGFRVYAIEQADESVLLQDFLPAPGEKVALVFGNEVRGVSERVVEIADGCIEIPQYGTKHSLNISVSAGVVVWDIFQKMKIIF